MFFGKVWDKKSPINGVPSDVIIAANPILKNGEASLVSQDDTIIVFQPHDPDTAGVMPMSYDRAFYVALSISKSYNAI